MLRIIQFVGFIITFLSFTVSAESILSSSELASSKKIVNNLCIACHAIDGNSLIPVNPKLAGQHALILQNNLKILKVDLGKMQ